jgi:membrane protein
VVLTRLKRLPERWPWLRFLLDIQGRFGELNGGYLASAITMTAFLSLFPLLLCISAVLGFVAGNQPDLSHDVIRWLGVPSQGEAATAIREAITTARESKAAASVIGVVGLLWSGLGLVAALQYVYNSAWQVTSRGMKDKVFGLLWLAGAGALFAASFAVTTVLQFLPGFLAPLNLIVGVAVSTGLFVWAAKVLPNVDVGWRALLPGSITAAVGFEVLKVVGAIYVPRAVASSSAVYGSLGVVFAIIAWLFFFGRLLVYSSIVNVVLWERGHGTVHLDIEVPAVPGRELEPEATRDGEATPDRVKRPDDPASQPEPVERIGTALPVAIDLHDELDVRAGRELLPDGRADVLEHRPTAANDHALLGVALDEDLATNARPFPLDHASGDRMGKLFTHGHEQLLPHQLSHPERLGNVGHRVGRVVQRTLGHARRQLVDQAGHALTRLRRHREVGREA